MQAATIGSGPEIRHHLLLILWIVEGDGGLDVSWSDLSVDVSNIRRSHQCCVIYAAVAQHQRDKTGYRYLIIAVASCSLFHSLLDLAHSPELCEG